MSKCPMAGGHRADHLGVAVAEVVRAAVEVDVDQPLARHVVEEVALAPVDDERDAGVHPELGLAGVPELLALREHLGLAREPEARRRETCRARRRRRLGGSPGRRLTARRAYRKAIPIQGLRSGPMRVRIACVHAVTCVSGLLRSRESDAVTRDRRTLEMVAAFGAPCGDVHGPAHAPSHREDGARTAVATRGVPVTTKTQHPQRMPGDHRVNTGLKAGAIGLVGGPLHGRRQRRADHRHELQRADRDRLRQRPRRPGRLPLRHHRAHVLHHRLRVDGAAHHHDRRLLRLHLARPRPGRRHGVGPARDGRLRHLRGLADRRLRVLRRTTR